LGNPDTLARAVSPREMRNMEQEYHGIDEMKLYDEAAEDLDAEFRLK